MFHGLGFLGASSADKYMSYRLSNNQLYDGSGAVVEPGSGDWYAYYNYAGIKPPDVVVYKPKTENDWVALAKAVVGGGVDAFKTDADRRLKLAEIKNAKKNDQAVVIPVDLATKVNSTNWMLIGGIGLGVAVGGYFLMKALKKKG